MSLKHDIQQRSALKRLGVITGTIAALALPTFALSTPASAVDDVVMAPESPQPEHKLLRDKFAHTGWVSLGSDERVAVGEEITIRAIGGIDDEITGSRTLQLQSWDGAQWNTNIMKKNDEDGHAEFTVTLAQTTEFRAIILDEDDKYAGESFTHTIEAYEPPPSGPATSSETVHSGQSSTSSAPYNVESSSAIVNAASAHLGKPYVFGAAGPSAFDCSGLVQYVFAQFGISTPHGATAQGNMGTAVSQAAAQPGDLILLGNPSYYHHIGIYIGDGKMIHAPQPGDVVKISTIWTNSYSVRRLA